MEVPLPPYLPCPVKALATKQIHVGAKLCEYIKKQMKTDVPTDFKDNCDALDALREQLRNSQAVTSETVENLTTYFNMLSKLTSGINISDKGAGAGFTYNNVTFYSIQFENVCMCYNFAVILFNNLNSMNADGKNFKQTVPMIKTLKSLLDRALEYHNEDFNKVITAATLDDLQSYANGDYNMAQHSVFVGMNKETKLAEYANLTAQKLKMINPPNEDYQKYYTAIASIYLGNEKYKNSEYGVAIGLFRQAYKIIPEPSTLKKSKSPFKEHWITLYNACKPQFDKMETENDKFFGEIIPRNLPDIPVGKATQLTGSIEWNKTTIETKKFDDSAASSLIQKVDNRLSNFREESSHALDDISKTLRDLPTAEFDEATNVHNQLIAKRQEAGDLSARLSQLLGIKAAQISQRNPNIFNQYGQLSQMLQKAYETDGYFEGQLATAQSRADTVRSYAQRLTDLQGSINAILDQAEGAAKLARESNGKSTEQTIEAMRSFEAALNELANQLNPIFADTFKIVKEAKAAAASITQESGPEVQSAINGFGQGLNCYSKLCVSFNNILTAVNQF